MSTPSPKPTNSAAHFSPASRLSRPKQSEGPEQKASGAEPVGPALELLKPVKLVIPLPKTRRSKTNKAKQQTFGFVTVPLVETPRSKRVLQLQSSQGPAALAKDNGLWLSSSTLMRARGLFYSLADIS